MPHRRPPWLGLAIAWACLLSLLLLPAAAQAEGKPNIGFAVAGPTSLLYGSNATLVLEADNPAGETTYGYNLSYRAVLPKGVAYVAGSTKLGSGAAVPAPSEYHNEATGETTLVWSNVGDLSPDSRETLSFEAKPSLAEYSVGGSFKVQAGAYIAEKPRYLPKFNSRGEPIGPSEKSYTGYATGSAQRTISALEITQSEGSPEGEILRGTQDQQTVYSVKVTNNSIKPTSEVEVEEWLPADLEFLGCAGAADNTTKAPTNPGSREEYPGSGLITIAKPTAGEGCAAPEIVKTEMTTPPGAPAAGVYTLVRWKPGTLEASGSKEYKFAAAIPLRENTTSWPAGEPTPSSGKQAANLDNNSGKETTDGEPIVTYAQAKGKFEGVTPVTAENQLERTAKDLRTEKTGSTSKLADGEVTVWTIKVESSEYRFNTGIVVTDTLPNGLCPLNEPNLTGSPECAPTGASEDLPHPAFASAKEAANGTWALVWNETTDPELTSLAANGTAKITFASRTRTNYQQNGKPAEPILAHDTVENSVLAAGTTNVVCAGHTTCSEKAEGHINHERPLNEPISDNSHFTQSAEGPTIDKEIAESGTNCLGDAYTSTTPVYHPGDLICWRLRASFPAALSTHGTQVTDFLPGLVSFDEAFNSGKGEAPTSEDTLPGTTFDHSEAGSGEAGGALKWTLPESGIVGKGSMRFERVFATNATLTKGTPLGDLQGNLMKFASINSKGESFAERAEANFKLQFPQLSLEKQIVKVNGKAIAPTSTATVEGGKEAEFALTVTNAGEVEALNTEVRDLLPNGLTCEAIVAGSISNKGICSEGRISWGETSLGQEAISVPANGKTVLHFTTKLPTTLDPATTLEDKAGVREYQSTTNTGGKYTYIPEKNIDPTLTEEQANVPAANAQAALKTEEVKTEKTHITSVVESGNSATQATIGEIVTFEVSATIPSGTTLSGVAKISDPSLPNTRLHYETGSVQALVNGSAAPASFSTEEPGGSPVVVLPENYGAPEGKSTKVTMRFKAIVTNVEANNAAGVEPAKSIPNIGKLAWTNPLSGPQTREPTDAVPLVEPKVTLSESNNSGGKVHGGQLVEYKLKVGNSGQSSAFNGEVVDHVPSGLTPTNKAGEPLANGASTESGGIWNEAERTITWKPGKIETGASKEQTLAFFVKVNESPVSSTSLKNSSEATIASLEVGGRTSGAPTPATIKPNYDVERSSTLEVEGATIAKTGTPEKATIGEKVTYTLTVTVPFHTVAYNETVIDTLPSTLEFVKYSSATCVSGCGPGTEIEPKPYTPENNTSAHTNRVAWYLGNVSSAPETRVLKLVYVALVRSTARAAVEPGAEVKAGNTLENSASLYYNTADSGYVFKEATVPPATFTKTVGPVHAKTTVIEPSVAVVKEAKVDSGEFSTATPFKVTDGDTITYRLKVTNSGTAPAYNVSVTDALPASGLVEVKTVENAPIKNKEAEVTKESASELAWSIPVLAASSEKPITLEYTAKLAPVTTLRPGQEIANTAKVPSYFGVPVAERTGTSFFPPHEAIEYRSYKGNEATLKAKVALPSISIEKAALEGAKYQASANAEVGQPFTWRVIVKNTSAVPAKNLKVIDKLPANWEYAGGASFAPGGSVTPTEAGTLEGGRELTWNTSIELAANESTILTYQAKPTLAAETNPGSGPTHPNTNTASASVLDAAGNPADAEGPFAAGPATAQGVLQVPMLTVSKNAVKESVPAGAKDEYTILIQNTGTGVAREVLAEDSPPAGLTYTAGSASASPPAGFSEKSVSATKVVWAIESIAPGAKVEIKMPVVTDAGEKSGTKLTNIVVVHAKEAPTLVKAEATITLTTSAELVAFKEVVGKGPYVPGTTIKYKLGATNEGPSVAKPVELSDKLPTGETFVKLVSTSGPPSECKSTSTTFNCEAAELAPKARLSYEIEVKLASSAEGTIANTVEVTSPTPDPEPANNKTEKKITVTPEADLKLEKTGPKTVITGEKLTWNLEVKNTGPSDAKGVKIIDPLPPGVTYESSSSPECSYGAGTVTCELVGLAANASTSVTITVGVTKTSGSLTNTATVSAPADSNPEKESTAITTVLAAPSIAKESDSPEATIGHRITYTLTVTVPAEATTYNQTVIDRLPATLDFDEYVSATCTAGCTTPETTIVPQTYEPKVLSSAPFTTSVAWYLGNLTAAPKARTVVLVYRASVRESPRGSPSEKVQASAEIKNSATLYFNQTDKGPFEEKTIPAPESFDRHSAEVSSTSKVVEPALTVTKEASVNGASFSAAPFPISSGDTVVYRLRVENTGTSSAYDVGVADVLPKGLTVIETLANHAATVTKEWSESSPEIDWLIAGPLAPGSGEAVTLEYKVKLAVGNVKNGEKLQNTGSVPSYFGVSEAERAEKLKNYFKEEIAYRKYKGPSAQLAATVVLPTISIEKTTGASGSPASADAEVGQPFPWRVVVKNTSAVVAKNVKVVDTLPANWEYVAGSAEFSGGVHADPTESGSPEPGRVLTWQTSIELAPGESTTLTYDAKPTVAAETTPGSGPTHPNINKASATVTDSAGDTEDAEGPFAAGPKQAEAILLLPSLEVSKTASKPTAVAGMGGDSYKIEVKNVGPVTAREVTVVDTLPEGMTYAAGSAKANPEAGFSEKSVVGSTITWKIASIGTGNTVEINVPVGIEASAEAGSKLKNEVAVTSTEQTTPVKAEGTIEVITSADIEAKKSVLGGATTAVPGDELTYVIAARNKEGPSVARAVELTDVLPASVSFVSASAGCAESAGTVTCEAGNLSPEQEASFQIVVSVLSGYSGSIANTVHAESTETPGYPATPDPDPTNNKAEYEVSTVPSADLELVKTALTPEIHPGQQASFSLVTTNKGPSDAVEARLIDTLPAGLAYVSASGASCEAAGQTVTCALGTIAAGNSVTVTLITQPVGLGSYVNTATVTSTTPDPDPGNNSSEATVKVVPIPATAPATATTSPSSGVSPSAGAMARTKVTLRKLVRERSVAPGGRLDYRLIVRNTGVRTAEGLRVCDTLPPQTTVINRGGGHLDGGRICFELATLAYGREHTFTLVLRADSDARGQIVNRAGVTGKNFDPAQARASTPVQKASLAPVRESHVTG